MSKQNFDAKEFDSDALDKMHGEIGQDDWVTDLLQRAGNSDSFENKMYEQFNVDQRIDNQFARLQDTCERNGSLDAFLEQYNKGRVDKEAETPTRDLNDKYNIETVVAQDKSSAKEVMKEAVAQNKDIMVLTQEGAFLCGGSGALKDTAGLMAPDDIIKLTGGNVLCTVTPLPGQTPQEFVDSIHQQYRAAAMQQDVDKAIDSGSEKHASGISLLVTNQTSPEFVSSMRNSFADRVAIDEKGERPIKNAVVMSRDGDKYTFTVDAASKLGQTMVAAHAASVVAQANGCVTFAVEGKEAATSMVNEMNNDAREFDAQELNAANEDISFDD